jgi:hypothetical protein
MDIFDTDDDLGASTVSRYAPERVHRLEKHLLRRTQQLEALREAARLLIDSGWRERGSDWSCVDPHYLSALIELLEESGDE